MFEEEVMIEDALGIDPKLKPYSERRIIEARSMFKE